MSRNTPREYRPEKETERAIVAEMKSCVHFTGIHKQECRAGLNYHAIFGDGFGCFKHLTCLSDPQGIPCSRAEYPTREQAEGSIREQDKKLNLMILMLSGAKDHAKSQGFGRGKGGAAEIPCPGCDGKFRYTVASVNGHMHGGCSHCGSFMQ